MVTADGNEAQVIISSEVSDNVMASGEQLGLEMFFEDGSYFVIIVRQAERFEAEEWDLDARFGHVAVISAECPAADEGFDCGLGAVLGQRRVG